MSMEWLKEARKINDHDPNFGHSRRRVTETD